MDHFTEWCLTEKRKFLEFANLTIPNIIRKIVSVGLFVIVAAKFKINRGNFLGMRCQWFYPKFGIPFFFKFWTPYLNMLICYAKQREKMKSTFWDFISKTFIYILYSLYFYKKIYCKYFSSSAIFVKWKEHVKKCQKTITFFSDILYNLFMWKKNRKKNNIFKMRFDPYFLYFIFVALAFSFVDFFFIVMLLFCIEVFLLTINEQKKHMVVDYIPILSVSFNIQGSSKFRSSKNCKKTHPYYKVFIF